MSLTEMNQRIYSHVNIEGGGLAHNGDLFTNSIFQSITREAPPPDPKLLLRDALVYEGASTREEQLSTRVIPSNSLQWIWSTSFRKWLSKSDRLYWITGRPGSGKSTLIHYLAHASKTRKYLCSNGQQYKTVHFFFDYRAGDSAANSQHGLIKCALLQLCNAFPDIEKQLAERNLHDSLKEKNTSHLLETLCGVLNGVADSICAFIDGLDEYTGDYASLAAFFTTLQDRTSIKLCLASRPEAAFKTAYGNLPSLAMQDHNSGSIKAYIDYAIKNAQDLLVDIDTVIDSSVRKVLHDRAQGVMIWARLATDGLVRAAATGVASTRISEILEDIPEDLEQMYNHTFLRMPQPDAQEAALLLFLINELDGAVNLQTLHGLWSFYEADFLRNQNVNVLISLDSFQKRLDTLIGSFIDIVENNPDKDREDDPQTLFSRYMRTQTASYRRPISFLSRKARELKFWGKAPEVRLIHKTLRSFIRRSDSVRCSVPPRIRTSYPDNVKSRICVDVIAAASDPRHSDLDELADRALTMAEEDHADPAPDAHTKILTRVTEDEKWKLRINALIHCIITFPKAARKLQLPCAPIYSTWRAAMKSPLMFLELQERSTPGYAKSLYRRYGESIDLRLAVEYGLHQYISEANGLGPSSGPHVWYALLEDTTLLSWELTLSSFRFNPVWRWLLQHSLLDLQLVDLENLLTLILVRCRGIPSKFLAFSGNIMASYADSLLFQRGFEFKWMSRMVYETLASLSSIPVVDSSGATFSDCDYTRKVCLSAMWAHYSYSFQVVASEPGQCVYYQNLERLFAKIIHENNHDNAVNNVCDKHGTSLHALISSTTDSKFEGWGRIVSTLIALARLGADPSIQHNGKTPLQLLEAKKFWQPLKMGTWATSPTEHITNTGHLSIAVKILQHHKVEGSWPEFEPIIEKYKLSGPALWKFDRDGKIVLEVVPNQEENSNQVVQRGGPDVSHAHLQSSTIPAISETINENNLASSFEEHFMFWGKEGPK